MNVSRAAAVAVMLFAPTPATAQDGRCAPDNAGLTLPDGFCAVVFADSLGRARHLTVAPNGDVLVAVPSRGDEGGVFLLRDVSGNGRADVRHRLVADPMAVDVQVRSGGGVSYLYYATYREVVRLRWRPGTDAVAGAPDTVVRDLPGARQHGIKTFTFGPGRRLYVNHGAPSNACQQEDRTKGSPGMDPCPLLDTTGGVWLYDAERSGQTRADGRRYATGLRNTVALAVRPADGELYGVIHGRDQLGPLWGYSDEVNAETPAEEFVRLVDGADVGWPYCHYDRALEQKVLAPEYGGDLRTVGRCASMERPLIGFPAHWAPDGLHFHTGTGVPARYRGGAFIAFHGSWNRAPLPQQGFNVVFVPFEGDHAGAWQVFADGFEAAGSRPVDITEGPDGSLYVSDDRGGRVYRILAFERR